MIHDSWFSKTEYCQATSSNAGDGSSPLWFASLADCFGFKAFWIALLHVRAVRARVIPVSLAATAGDGSMKSKGSDMAQKKINSSIRLKFGSGTL